MVSSPVLAGGTAAGPCGMMHYTPGEGIALRYVATHPAGYAKYRFSLVRGATPLPEAAFSENLYIWNMNFSGWSRVGPDASFVRAFALALT